MILNVAFLLLILSMALTLFRAVKGPTPYDRILACNLFGTCTVLFIAMLSHLEHLAYLLDVALVYGLINFTTTIALLRYFKHGGFNDMD